MGTFDDWTFGTDTISVEKETIQQDPPPTTYHGLKQVKQGTGVPLTPDEVAVIKQHKTEAGNHEDPVNPVSDLRRKAQAAMRGKVGLSEEEKLAQLQEAQKYIGLAVEAQTARMEK